MKKNDLIKEMPIVESIIRYREKDTLALHMPGHKRGSVYKEMGLCFPWETMFEYDTTEVDCIDNLHFPEGAILEAQKRAARVFHGDETFFLVNGTSAGILAMIHGVTEEGDTIIIPRNCHKSVFNAVVLGRLNPVYILPEREGLFDVPMGIRPEAIRETLEAYPEAKAVVITNPTFYGACSDLEEIARIVHEKGKILLVDEAHGAHFGQVEIGPKSAMDCGADGVAQSTHKCLGSFTGTSMFHVKGDGIDREKLRFYLQAYQTTSPNHVMLASLDSARYQIESPAGKEKLRKVLELGEKYKEEIDRIPGFLTLSKHHIGIGGIHEVDPTRMTVSVKGLGITGVEAERFLLERFNIQLEMVDLNNIVAIFTIGDTEKDFVRFKEALVALSKEFYHEDPKKETAPTDMEHIPFQLPEKKITPWEAMIKKKKVLSLSESMGEIAGEMLVPYPPGIPIIMPGEGITAEIVEYLSKCIECGIKVNSSSGNTPGKVSVVVL